MKTSTRAIVGTAALCAVAYVHAQGFPEGATTPQAEEIRTRLGGHVFSVKLADRTSWRLDFKTSGTFFIDTSAGFRSNGEWAAEDGKLCSQLRGRERACNEVRVHQDTLHLKRTTGEFIQYVPK